jgi:hypothetical protein
MGACGAGRLVVAGEAVVLGEVARRGAHVAEGIGDAAHGLLGNVLVELQRSRELTRVCSRKMVHRQEA